MKSSFLISILLCFIFISCKNDTEKQEIKTTSVKTLLVEESNTNGVWVTGTVETPIGELIQDYGFIYYLDNYFFEMPDEALVEKLSLGSPSDNNFEFEGILTENLLENRRFVVRAFAKVNDIINYGEEVEFTSYRGSSEDKLTFSPDSANIGDTLIIKGHYFGNRNFVEFDLVKSVPFSVCDTSMKVIVPKGMEKCSFKLKLNVAGQNVYTNNLFTIKAPRIDSVSKSKVVSRNEINLYGVNFSTIKQVKINEHKVNTYQYTMDLVTDSLLKIRIPMNIPLGKLSISFDYLDREITYPDQLEGILPIIESFSPKKVWYNDTLLIKGTNLLGIYDFEHPKLDKYDNSNKIIQQTDSLIQILIKRPVLKQKIKAKYNRHIINSDKELCWLEPSIESVNKQTIYGDDEILIKGENFIKETEVKIGDKYCAVTFINENTISVRTLAYPGPQNISLHYEGFFDTITPFVLNVLPAKILDVQPKVLMRGQVYTITTENVNPNSEPHIEILNKYTTQIEKSDNSYKVLFDSDHYISIDTKPEISLQHGSQLAEFTEGLAYKNPWEPIKDKSYHDYVTYLGNINESPLIFSDRKLYLFNPISEEWEFKSDFSYPMNGFYRTIFQDKLIILLRNDNKITLKSYAIFDKEWKTEFIISDSEEFSGNLFSFEKGDELFIGNKSMLKSFNLKTLKWKNKTPIPSISKWQSKPLTFEIGNKIYFAVTTYYDPYGKQEEQEKSFIYDFTNDSWEENYNFTLNILSKKTVAIKDQKAFIISKGWNRVHFLHIFNSVDNTYDSYVPPTGAGTNSACFIYNEFLYFMNSYNNNIFINKCHINKLIPIDN
ncbi:hypothetical protein EO244_05875 [Ancylomarina salipaludis]|uniref:IPT/TIG domain-containing protein n=1 Tax=Ancylomarina salipaludis TaxID=2501299 RepID=A0A4Q1JML4_9BACT|nr:IPT/TIG domain-containing protein [Ancylomarina salipaludis]RXQ95835.1 hypothetical protein EO244_05875 [Ancylomarina salipaludis]